MNRKQILIWIIGAALVIFAIMYFLINRDTEQEVEVQKVATSSYEGTMDITIEDQSNYGIEWKNTTEDQYFNRITDITDTYEINTNPKSNLKVTRRILDNGDYYIFTSLYNKSGQPIELDVSMHVADTRFYSFRSFEKHMSAPRFTSDIKHDLTTTPYGLITNYIDKEIISNVMVGKMYQSTELVEEYEDGRKSKLRELIAEKQNIDFDIYENEFNLVLEMETEGNDIIDHWLLFSDELLFDTFQSYDDWIKIHNNKKYKNNTWYTAEGPYKKVVRTAQPTPESELQYGQNLLIVREDEILKRYKETEERYFYNMLLNSVANLTIFKGDKDFWETKYTNGWLNRVYDIQAPYIDTRHNEGVALFLEETGNLLDIPEITTALTNYADLLVSQTEAGQVVDVGENAYLISDYFTFHQEVNKTHSSLNHVLGGMNLLLETYLKTGDEKYLTTATYIQNGINELGDKWLNEKGDTWYQINPDYTFQGEDYTLLTLTDLLTSLDLWKEIGNMPVDTLEMLIESKAMYLIGEDIGFTQEIKQLLNEHGFEEVLEELEKG